MLKQLEFEFRRVIKIGFLLLFLGSVLTAIRDGNAASYTPPAGVPAPSFANNFVVINQINNGNDATGYGNVSYEYQVSATQITVDDWVAFLNAVDPLNQKNLKSWYKSGWESWMPYQHNGSSWSVKSQFNNGAVDLSASDAGKLPVDGISLNQVARYMNWLATGNINTGAFTFVGSSGNSDIATFDHTYPGPRLPLENELYKAMYWDKGKSGYNLYPNGTNLPPSAAQVNTGTGDYTTGASTALFGAWYFANPGSNTAWVKVGQESSGNPWGIHDMSGNRHETTLELSGGTTGAPTGNAILRGASGFDTPIEASRSDWRNPAGGNNGAGSYTLSSQEPSIGFRVWMGVTVPSSKVQISKTVTGGTDPQSFSIKLDCSGTNHDKTISLLHGGTYLSAPIPKGTSCTVSETVSTPPSGKSYGSPIITPSSFVIDDTTINVTVTNPLQTACAISAFTITPSCNNNGTAGTAADDYRTFTLNLSGTGVAATYNLSSNNSGVLTPTSGSYGAATNFRLQNGSAGNGTVYTLTATDATSSSCTRTATVSDTGSCSPTGTLRVRKTVTNPPAAFSSPNFNIAVDCSDNTFDQNFTLAHGATRDITGIPAGTMCSVTETTPLPTAPAGYEYGTPAIAPSGAQTIVANTTTEIVVTNPLNSVSCPTITVTPNPLPNGTVGVAYNASLSASASSGGPYTYTWSAVGLPTGMNVNAGTGAVSGTPSATGNATVTASTTVAGQTCSGSTPLSVTAAPTGSLSVTKAVTGKPASFTSPDFSVVVDCSVDSFDQTLTVADGATATINSIPTGTTCTVTEPTVPAAPAGYDYGTPVITPSGEQTISTGTTVAVTVTNPLTLKQGSLQLSKSVSGQPAGFTSPDYTLHVDCSDNSFDQDVLIKAAENKTISNIPHGTTCTVTEPTQPAPPAGYSYGTAVITPASVTIVGDSSVSVSVLNPLEGNCTINVPTVTTQCYSNGTSSTADDTFGFRINTSGTFVAPTYDIQAGTLAVQDVPYGVDAGTYGNFLISGGVVNATLTDSNKATCQLNNVALTPPAPCSAPPPTCATVTNKAKVSALTGTDQNPGNDEDGVSLGANCATPPQIDLELVKTASVNTIKRGDTLVYTLTLTNKGPDDANDVQVKDLLPAGLSYVSSQAERGSYDATSGIWLVGKVANGVPVKLKITVRAD